LKLENKNSDIQQNETVAEQGPVAAFYLVISYWKNHALRG
jgi:hypothetical protein